MAWVSGGEWIDPTEEEDIPDWDDRLNPERDEVDFVEYTEQLSDVLDSLIEA